MFAELTQRALDAEFDETYDERGNFARKRIDTKEYWYYRRSVGGEKRFTYVGPVGDKAISDRVRRFEDIGVELLLCKMIPDVENIRTIAGEIIAPMRGAVPALPQAG